MRPLFMFVHLTKRTKFHVRVCLFNKRTNTNELPAERFTNYTSNVWFVCSPNLDVQGGGNAGNALTCAARLGLNARLISKVASDAQGRGILEELKADGVDVSFFVVSEEGNSPFTYVIVDNQTKTRTCIHTPGSPPMVPDDISNATMLAALAGVKLVYFDVRLPDTALLFAHEANRRKIPILIDAERPREGLDDLLNLSDYVVCSAKFPQASC
ncbi:putative ribokinase [Helianthus anomalus]